MGDNQQTATLFPTPPPFYKHFTKANIAQLQRIKKEGRHAQTDDNAPVNAQTDSFNILQLPPELRHLIPPLPPVDGKWRTFGTEHDHNAPDPSLQDAGVEQLFPDDPSVKLAPQPHLLALVRSMLTTFLSITGILAQNPALYEEKVQDLRTMAINMHDLINRYRPHQARESLILMMEKRVKGMQSEIKAIAESHERLGKVLQGIQDTAAVQAPHKFTEELPNNSSQVADQERRSRHQAAWNALKEMNRAQDEGQRAEAAGS